MMHCIYPYWVNLPEKHEHLLHLPTIQRVLIAYVKKGKHDFLRLIRYHEPLGTSDILSDIIEFRGCRFLDVTLNSERKVIFNFQTVGSLMPQLYVNGRKLFQMPLTRTSYVYLEFETWSVHAMTEVRLHSDRFFQILENLSNKIERHFHQERQDQDSWLLDTKNHILTVHDNYGRREEEINLHCSSPFHFQGGTNRDYILHFPELNQSYLFE